LQPLRPTVEGAPISPEERNWLLTAMHGIKVGWHFTPPGGVES
jgi:hypothetical protein